MSERQLQPWIRRGSSFHMLTSDGASAGIVQETADTGGANIGCHGWYAGVNGRSAGGKLPTMTDARERCESELRDMGADVPEFTGWSQ